MKFGVPATCDLTGFVEAHARACETVADRFNCIITFREPGKMAQRLIDESYAMKGFRIDTKSSDWGPMAGFVCADPRLSKGMASKLKFNEEYTGHALSGHIGDSFVIPNKEDLALWKADVMPIVLSADRVAELEAKNIIRCQAAPNGHKHGMSAASDNSVTVYWRLVPLGNAEQPWVIAGKKLVKDDKVYYALCVNDGRFKQLYPAGVKPIMFRGYETLLGMTNPGSAQTHGFKACVTADYDLFAVFPACKDQMGQMHQLSALFSSLNKHTWAFMPNSVPRLPGVDDRLRTTQDPLGPKAQRFEHYQHGDVSARIVTIKVALNSAIMGAGYRGGNPIHHNDEAGNEFLAKGNIDECLPVVAFLPRGVAQAQTIALEKPATTDFRLFYDNYIKGKFVYRAKKSWAAAAGVTLTGADTQSAY